jgi:hypothetical protein
MPTDDPGDLTEVPTEELVRLAQQISDVRRAQQQAADATAKRQGLYVAELVRRPGFTYAKVAELLGIDDSTAHRLARRAQE